MAPGSKTINGRNGICTIALSVGLHDAKGYVYPLWNSFYNTGLSKLMHLRERDEENCMLISLRPETKTSIHSLSVFVYSMPISIVLTCKKKKKKKKKMLPQLKIKWPFKVSHLAVYRCSISLLQREALNGRGFYWHACIHGGLGRSVFSE